MTTNTAEKTNPVMDTARLTLSQLAAAGIHEAEACAQKLGLTRSMENYDVSQKQIVPFAVMQEARFQFMNHYFRQAGCENIVDIACGFSPRGLLMARQGFRYLGLDLQAAVTAMSQVAADVAAEETLPGSFRYQMVDITDPAAFSAAVDALRGPAAMGCEGLLVYLGRYEFESLLQGLSNVLHAHGGCFITPDLVSRHFMFGIFTAILGDEAGKKALMALASRIEEKSDTVFRGTLTSVPMEEWAVVFAKYGLQYELVPFLPEDAELNSFAMLTPEQIAAIRRNLAPVRCLKLTAAPQTQKTTFSSRQFSVTLERAGESLTGFLSGRLDSLSAPKFLEQYEQAKAEGKISSLTLDAGNLDYISSAGLRTLLIMRKALPDAQMQLRNVNDQVMEILEQTGFTSILDVI